MRVDGDFTDFGFAGIGVPRNNAIPANADHHYYDLGLCGPAREDLSQKPETCGKFKVPTLRNVALRKRFFHDGAFDSLEQVVRFYVTRDTQAPTWYPTDASGVTQIYNDLPQELRGNVNVTEGPYNRRLGEAAALNESEIKDLLSFLGTLSDGYKP